MTDKIIKQSRIPEFSSIEEEAEFWGTHSTADYEDEFKPVEVRFGKNLSDDITVHVDSATGKKIRSLARKRGVGAVALINMWIKEHVKETRHSNFLVRDKQR